MVSGPEGTVCSSAKPASMSVPVWAGWELGTKLLGCATASVAVSASGVSSSSGGTGISFAAPVPVTVGRSLVDSAVAWPEFLTFSLVFL